MQNERWVDISKCPIFFKDFGHFIVASRVIVNHRKKFTAWSGLDYTRHLPHTISFLPPEDIEDVLRDDYKQMQIGFIYANAPSFDEIMERLSELQSRFRTLVWKNNR